ncbi:MAG: nuclear transport factor 2 family protein [Alphaproteobacteria bacterium]
MAFNGPLEDRLAIHELVASYADAVCRRNAEDWGATWAEDSVWKVPGFPGLEHVEGRAAIVAAWSEAMTNYTLNYMAQTMGALEVQGDTATGRTHNAETGIDLDGNTRQHVGTYEDQYVKRDGRWLFASRTYTPRHSY